MIEQDKRQRIMQAAEKLFSSRRFHEITTDDVAREAKVGKGIPAADLGGHSQPQLSPGSTGRRLLGPPHMTIGRTRQIRP